MKTRGPSLQGPIAFMRMRSPSSAPPLLRRDGSIEITAMLQRVVLVEAQAPDQLVGQARLAGAAGAGDAEHRRLRRRSPRARSSSQQRRRDAAVLERGDQLRQRAPRRLGSRPRIAASAVGACGDRSTSQRIIISPIMPARPMRWPSSGL